MDARTGMGFRLIDAIHENVRVSQSVKYAIDDIAAALGVVGMHDLAERLHEMAKQTLEAAEEVSRVHSGKLSDDLREADAFTGLLLKATLEGCLQPSRERRR